MGIKKEIYYRFTFPNYNNLSGIDNANFGTDKNPVLPTSDGIDQTGEVLSLCRACPERVITYDQLAETSSANLVSIYKDAWEDNRQSTQPYNRSFIKECVDEYLKIPKYFNLRNYEDGVVTQRLGMSLMVSDSPEVGGDYSNYTKFNYGGKVVYCAVMVSSGDFFYNFCLPNEVIEKSGLRDEVVRPMQYNGGGTPWIRFHSNWCCTIADRTALKNPDLPKPVNVQVGQEKRVFAQHYFNDSFGFGVQNKDNNFYYFDFTSNLTGKTYSPFDEVLRCVDKNGSKVDELGNHYTGSNKNFPIKDFVEYYYIDGNENDRLTRNEYRSKEGIETRQPWKCVESADNYHEDLKGDFIDLEVTRRILYYSPASNMKLKYNGVTRSIHPTQYIPRIDGGIHYNTKLSYEPPAEYVDKLYTYLYNNYSTGYTTVSNAQGTPPLQIPYNLLRYCLNDRPPFTDCETVLVMWIADRDPNTVADGNVEALHNLNWQQYAIPISCRCRYKDGSSPKHCNERFLVEFPKYWDLKVSDGSYIREQSHLAYRFHTRRSEGFTDVSKFQEVMYLHDLINYSNNYMVVYQNSDYLGIGFDTQGYLLSNYPGAFKKLYCLKTYLNTRAISDKNTAASNNLNGQFYYIRINQEYTNKEEVFIISGYNSSSDRRICFRNTSNTAQLIPSDYIYRLNVSGGKWDPSGSIAPSTRVNILDTVRDWGFDDITYHEDYGYNDWKIDDKRFIALFDPDYTVNGSKVFYTLKNVTLSLKKSYGSTLRQRLDNGNWDEFYISSFGVTRYNPISIDAIFRTGDGDYIKAYPIGVLDECILLDGVSYGSNTTNGVVVGFANMLDFHQEDLYHFKWNDTDGYYEPIKITVNYTSNSMSVTYSVTSLTCTAYIMKYPN